MPSFETLMGGFELGSRASKASELTTRRLMHSFQAERGGTGPDGIARRVQVWPACLGQNHQGRR